MLDERSLYESLSTRSNPLTCDLPNTSLFKFFLSQYPSIEQFLNTITNPAYNPGPHLSKYKQAISAFDSRLHSQFNSFSSLYFVNSDFASKIQKDVFIAHHDAFFNLIQCLFHKALSDMSMYSEPILKSFSQALKPICLDIAQHFDIDISLREYPNMFKTRVTKLFLDFVFHS